MIRFKLEGTKEAVRNIKEWEVEKLRQSAKSLFCK
jgi:hypothetical protein